MNPAVKEALTSSSSFFQDQEFDRLKEYHELYGEELFGNMEPDIQNVTDTLEQNYQNIEENIENILSNPDE